MLFYFHVCYAFTERGAVCTYQKTPKWPPQNCFKTHDCTSKGGDSNIPRGLNNLVVVLVVLTSKKKTKWVSVASARMNWKDGSLLHAFILERLQNTEWESSALFCPWSAWCRSLLLVTRNYLLICCCWETFMWDFIEREIESYSRNNRKLSFNCHLVFQ